MGKLRKFLIKPERFWDDYFRKKDLAKLFAELSSKRESRNSFDFGSLTSTEDPIKLVPALFTFIQKRFRSVLMPDSGEGVPHLGLLEAERIPAIKLITVFAQQFSASLSILSGKKFIPIENATYRNIVNYLSKQQTWVLKISLFNWNPMEENRACIADISKKIEPLLRSLIQPDSEIDELFRQSELTSQLLRISFWQENDDYFENTNKNLVGRKIPIEHAAQSGIFEAGKCTQLAQILPCRPDYECPFSVDFVFTWVNHQDLKWREQYMEAVKKQTGISLDALSLDRFMNRNELKYSLRSISSFAPWARKIWIVSNCQPPAWLNTRRDDICWIDHSEILAPDHLPTFNSHAIESRLHKIEGLSEHFVYLNDDMFLGRPLQKHDFFTSTGMSYSTLEDYGMVNGSTRPQDPDYLNAARNGKRLMEDRFNVSPTQLHTHSPYCLTRSVIVEMENTFPLEFEKTAKESFRTIDDISVPSFFYHHYSYQIHKSIRRTENTALLKARNKDLTKKLENIHARSYFSFCVNDGDLSSESMEWNNFVILLLESVFPASSKYEKK